MKKDNHILGKKIILPLMLLVVSLIVIVNGSIDSITLQEPVNSNIINNATPNFSFITVGNRITYDCELFVNTVPFGRNSIVANNSVSYIVPNMSLSEGLNVWNVNCTNTSDNASLVSLSRNLTIDTSSPIISGGMNLNDIDGYYWPNDLLKVNFTITDLYSNVTNVTFNLSQINSGVVRTFNTSVNDIWNVSTLVNHTMTGVYVRNISVVYCDSFSTCNSSSFVIGIYNFTEPSIFTNFTELDLSLSTNISNITDLSSVNYVLGLKLNGTNMDANLWNDTRLAARFEFRALNLTNNSVYESLVNLSSAIIINYSNPKEGVLRGTRIYVNDSQIPAFDRSTQVTLYNLPYTSMNVSSIINDTGSSGSNAGIGNLSVVSNGNGTINLTFDVSGFSGYNITDNINPNITVTTPVKDSEVVIMSFSFTINGTGTEMNYTTLNITGVGANYSYYWNYSNISCAMSMNNEIADCNFNGDVANDNYNFTISVYDFGGASGNFGWINITNVTMSGHTPNATVIFPSSYSHESNEMLELIFKIDDIDPGIFVNYSIYVDNVFNGQTGKIVQNMSVALNITNSTGGNLTEGIHTIIIEAFDADYHYRNTSEIIFIYDASSPTVVLNSTFMITSDVTPSFNFTATDVLDGILDYSIYVDNVSNGQTGTATSGAIELLSLATLSEGYHSIFVRVNDDAGNLINSNSVVYGIDTSGATIVITSPNPFYTQMENFTVNFTATDFFNNNVSCNTSIVGRENVSMVHWNVLNGTTVSANVSLPQGIYDFNITCWDKFGFITNESVTLVRDLSGPTFNEIIKSRDYASFGDELMFTLNVTDNETSVSSVFFDDNSLAPYVGDLWRITFTPNISSGFEGLLNFEMNATNLLNQTSFQNTSVIIDNTMPIISNTRVYTTGAESFFLTEDMEIEATFDNVTFMVEIAEENLNEAYVLVDEGLRLNFIQNESDFYITGNTLLTPGYHVIRSYISDRVNNTNDTLYRVRFNINVSVDSLTNYIGTNGGVNITSVKLIDINGTDLAGDITKLNKNVTLSVNVSTDQGAANIVIPEFYGLNAYWNRSFLVDNSNQDVINRARDSMGLNVSEMVFVKNMSRFINETFYSANISFNRNIVSGGELIAYFADDSASSIEIITRTPCGANDVLCYNVDNVTNRTIVKVPHFSGIAVLADQSTPIIAFNSPSANNTYSYNIPITGAVFDSNISASISNNSVLCKYSLNSPNPNTDVVMTKISQRQFNFNILPGVVYPNGANYIKFYCTDSDNNSIERRLDFNVSDSTAPTMTNVEKDEVGRDRISILFTVNEPIDFTIEYGLTTSYGSSITGSSSAGVARGTLLGLTKNKTYRYKVTACDNQSIPNCASYANSFETLDDAEAFGESQPITGGGSSGGSGAVSGNLGSSLTASRKWPLMVSGDNVFNIDDGLEINSVTLNIRKEQPDGEIKIARLSKRPSGVSQINHFVYKYFEIKTANIPEGNLNYATIAFTVTRDFLKKYDLTDNEIALFRYTDHWEELPTDWIKDTEDKIYFEAETEGFSYFAIAQREILPIKQRVVTTTSTTTSSVVTTTIEKEAPAPVITPPKEKKKIVIPKWLMITIAVVLILPLFVFIIYKDIQHDIFINRLRNKIAMSQKIMKAVNFSLRRKKQETILDLVPKMEFEEVEPIELEKHTIISEEEMHKKIEDASHRMEKVRDMYDKVIHTKFQDKIEESVALMSKKIEDIGSNFETYSFEKLEEEYEEIAEIYKKLPTDEKDKYYPIIKGIVKNLFEKKQSEEKKGE